MYIVTLITLISSALNVTILSSNILYSYSTKISYFQCLKFK
jgi:hypothetical protein